ncbi:hypothetical protein ACSW9O_15860 (plasmid) [Clostridium perfringens]|nr:hypothetical protein [Clostridium perfringens]
MYEDSRVVYCNEPTFKKPPIPGTKHKKIRQENHYNSKVWSNTYTDKIRKTNCLCFNCNNIDNCNTAKSLYEICKIKNMALMVTRCKEFNFKEV